jgi:hypothetical protein
MALFDAKEKHIIVFDETTSSTPMSASSTSHVVPVVMGTPFYHDKEQMIVFETETITPACLFLW